jgi:hypothetical protein
MVSRTCGPRHLRATQPRPLHLLSPSKVHGSRSPVATATSVAQHHNTVDGNHFFATQSRRRCCRCGCRSSFSCELENTPSSQPRRTVPPDRKRRQELARIVEISRDSTLNSWPRMASPFAYKIRRMATSTPRYTTIPRTMLFLIG